MNALDKKLIENPGGYALETHTIVGLCLICGFIFMAIVERIFHMFKDRNRLLYIFIIVAGSSTGKWRKVKQTPK